MIFCYFYSCVFTFALPRKIICSNQDQRNYIVITFLVDASFYQRLMLFVRVQNTLATYLAIMMILFIISDAMSMHNVFFLYEQWLWKQNNVLRCLKKPGVPLGQRSNIRLCDFIWRLVSLFFISFSVLYKFKCFLGSEQSQQHCGAISLFFLSSLGSGLSAQVM